METPKKPKAPSENLVKSAESRENTPGKGNKAYTDDEIAWLMDFILKNKKDKKKFSGNKNEFFEEAAEDLKGKGVCRDAKSLSTKIDNLAKLAKLEKHPAEYKIKDVLKMINASNNYIKLPKWFMDNHNIDVDDKTKNYIRKPNKPLLNFDEMLTELNQPSVASTSAMQAPVKPSSSSFTPNETAVNITMGKKTKPRK